MWLQAYFVFTEQNFISPFHKVYHNLVWSHWMPLFVHGCLCLFYLITKSKQKVSRPSNSFLGLYYFSPHGEVLFLGFNSVSCCLFLSILFSLLLFFPISQNISSIAFGRLFEFMLCCFPIIILCILLLMVLDSQMSLVMTNKNII